MLDTLDTSDDAIRAASLRNQVAVLRAFIPRVEPRLSAVLTAGAGVAERSSPEAGLAVLDKLAAAIVGQIERHIGSLADPFDQLDLEAQLDEASAVEIPSHRLARLCQVAADIAPPTCLPVTTHQVDDQDATVPPLGIRHISHSPEDDLTQASQRSQPDEPSRACNRPYTLTPSLSPSPSTTPKRYARDHLTHDAVISLVNATLFSAAPGTDRPLNTALCIVYDEHDLVLGNSFTTDAERNAAILDARKTIKRSMRDTLSRMSTGPVTGLYVEELARTGGQGLHQHGLWHVPEDNYEHHLRALLRVLARQFSTRLQRLCVTHGIPITSRKPMALYDALLPIKRQAESNISKAVLAVRRGESGAVERLEAARAFGRTISLPFLVSTPKGGEGKPLPFQHVLNRQVPYLCKSILPTIAAHDAEGRACTLADLSRDNGGDVTLQRQASTRPPRVAIVTASLSAEAQAEAGWIAPTVPLEHYLSAKIRKAANAKHAARNNKLAEPTTLELVETVEMKYTNAIERGPHNHAEVQVPEEHEAEASSEASPGVKAEDHARYGRSGLDQHSGADLPRLHPEEQGRWNPAHGLRRRTRSGKARLLQVGFERCARSCRRWLALAGRVAARHVAGGHAARPRLTTHTR